MGVDVDPVGSIAGVALNVVTLRLWYKSEWVCTWATLSSKATVILVPWQGEGVVLTPWWPKSSERCCDLPVNSPASDLLNWVDMPSAKCDVATETRSETMSGTERVTVLGFVWLTDWASLNWPKMDWRTDRSNDVTLTSWPTTMAGPSPSIWDLTVLTVTAGRTDVLVRLLGTDKLTWSTWTDGLVSAGLSDWLTCKESWWVLSWLKTENSFANSTSKRTSSLAVAIAKLVVSSKDSFCMINSSSLCINSYFCLRLLTWAISATFFSDSWTRADLTELPRLPDVLLLLQPDSGCWNTWDALSSGCIASWSSWKTGTLSAEISLSTTSWKWIFCTQSREYCKTDWSASYRGLNYLWKSARVSKSSANFSLNSEYDWTIDDIWCSRLVI